MQMRGWLLAAVFCVCLEANTHITAAVAASSQSETAATHVAKLMAAIRSSAVRHRTCNLSALSCTSLTPSSVHTGRDPTGRRLASRFRELQLRSTMQHTGAQADVAAMRLERELLSPAVAVDALRTLKHWLWGLQAQRSASHL